MAKVAIREIPPKSSKACIMNCRHPGCEEPVPSTKGRRGRPQIWCEEHGSTKYASRRTRAGVKTPKPSCCPPRGKCDQHRQATRMARSALGRKAHDTGRNRDVLAELADVWGVASIWSADLYKPVAAWVKFDGDQG